MGGFANVFGQFVKGYAEKSQELLKNKMEKSQGLMNIAAQYAHVADTSMDPDVRKHAADQSRQLMDEATKAMNQKHGALWNMISKHLKNNGMNVPGSDATMPAEELRGGQDQTTQTTPSIGPLIQPPESKPTDQFSATGTPQGEFPTMGKPTELAQPPTEAQISTPVTTPVQETPAPSYGGLAIPKELAGLPPAMLRPILAEVAAKRINAAEANQFMKPIADLAGYVAKKDLDARVSGGSYGAYEALKDPEFAKLRVAASDADRQYNSRTGKKLIDIDAQMKAFFPGYDVAVKQVENESQADRVAQSPDFKDYQAKHPTEAYMFLNHLRTGIAPPALAGVHWGEPFKNEKGEWVQEARDEKDPTKLLATVPATVPSDERSQQRNFEAFKSANRGKFKTDEDAKDGFLRMQGTAEGLKLLEQQANIDAKQELTKLRQQRTADAANYRTEKDARRKADLANRILSRAGQAAANISMAGTQTYNAALKDYVDQAGLDLEDLKRTAAGQATRTSKEKGDAYLSGRQGKLLNPPK